MDSEDMRRRLKAARALTPPTDAEVAARAEKKRDFVGITTAELAARVNQPGLGYKLLGNIERGTRTVRAYEIAPIAQAMGLPEEFFTLSRPQLLEALGDDAAPPVPGETGRRLLDRRPTGEDLERPETDRGEDRTGAASE